MQSDFSSELHKDENVVNAMSIDHANVSLEKFKRERDRERIKVNQSLQADMRHNQDAS